MADQIQGQTHGSKARKRPTLKRGESKQKKPRLLKIENGQRARVDIGLAFETWRALKAAKGLRSDAEVAMCLLDSMKRLPSESESPGPSNKKIKFVQSEVQTMIEQEVHSALMKNETKLKGLLEAIQGLDRRVDYENSIKKLQARINTVTQRSEAALSYMAKKKKKTPHPSLVNADIMRSDTEDENKEAVFKSKTSAEGIDSKSGELLNIMETTQKAVETMQADQKAVTAAVAALTKELSPPVLTPYGSPDYQRIVTKKEPESFEESKPFEEPVVKTESPSPGCSNRTEQTDSNQPKDKPSYPPLPPTTFPSVLNMEAASYNIPQRPVVRLALIRYPAGLSVLWSMPEKDPSPPPMDSYRIIMCTEKPKGSGIFPKWTNVGDVKAIELPMCVMISKYKRGHTVCVAVVGRDKFGRFGPYSEVVTADIPE